MQPRMQQAEEVVVALEANTITTLAGQANSWYPHEHTMLGHHAECQDSG